MNCAEPHTHHHTTPITVEISTNCYIFWRECDCGHRIPNGADETEKLADVIEDEVYGFIKEENNHDTKTN